MNPPNAQSAQALRPQRHDMPIRGDTAYNQPPMPRPDATHRQRLIRLFVATGAFMVGAAVVLVMVIRGYLLPAYEAWSAADPRQRSMLSASSALLLSVVLVVLFVLLIAVFGVRRYFFPTPRMERTKTDYVDAWAESARRAKPIPPDAEDSSR